MKKILLITLMLVFGLTGFSQTTWTGATSGVWNLASNWSPSTIPTATNDVVIPNVATNFPGVLSGATAYAKSITITGTEPSGLIELFVHGTLTVTEGITVSNAASVFNVWSGGKVFYSGDVDVSGSLIVNGTMEYLPVPTVTNSTTGETWMDRNLGASQVATASNDALAFGDLYQWGRATEGHEDRLSGTTSTNATTAVPNAGLGWDGLFITEPDSPDDWLEPQADNLWQGVIGTNNPCPTGFRLPTEDEWEAEHLTWESQNTAGAFGSPLKLVFAGRRNNDGIFNGGYYWSSTPVGTGSKTLDFGSTGAAISPYNRVAGVSVRCIKD